MQRDQIDIQMLYDNIRKYFSQMNTTYVFLGELGIHLNHFCNMPCYNFITMTLDTLYMQCRFTGRALVVQSVPSAHWGCAVNHRCITLTDLEPFFTINTLRHTSVGPTMYFYRFLSFEYFDRYAACWVTLISL